MSTGGSQAVLPAGVKQPVRRASVVPSTSPSRKPAPSASIAWFTKMGPLTIADSDGVDSVCSGSASSSGSERWIAPSTVDATSTVNAPSSVPSTRPPSLATRPASTTVSMRPSET